MDSRLLVLVLDEASIDEKDISPENEKGWVSWAWSYVPQILPDADELLDENFQPKKRTPHVLSIGLYAHKGTIVFKVRFSVFLFESIVHKKLSPSHIFIVTFYEKMHLNISC